MNKLFEEQFTDAPAPPILGRSELERWANCPAQAHFIESGAVSDVSTPALVGDAVHKILSAAMVARVNDGLRANDVRELIADQATNARPDIQPQVVEALKRCYPIVDLICRRENGEERHPEDLLRFDGGELARSGQLAAVLEPYGSPAPARDHPPTVTLTCELDLMLATASPEELDLVDWKSGWAHWTATDVRDSFQFQFYAYLVLRNYPEVQTVRVRVYMPRLYGMTGTVEFRRADMYAIGQRILSSVRIWQTWAGNNGGFAVPAWPTPEKCGMCPASRICPMASEPDRQVPDDPERALRRLVALTAAADVIREGLTRIVRKGIPGQRDPGDLVFGELAFGVNKPSTAKPRAKPCQVYQIGGKGETDEVE